MIDPKRLDELEALEKAATEPPWTACERGAYRDFQGNSRVLLSADIRVGVIQTDGRPETEANADLVAATRNDLPALIATAREAVEMREALEAWHAPYEGRSLRDITFDYGPLSGARVRMTRKALGRVQV